MLYAGLVSRNQYTPLLVPELARYHTQHSIQELGVLAVQAKNTEFPELELHILNHLARSSRTNLYLYSPEDSRTIDAAYASLLGRLGAAHEAHAMRIGIEADIVNYAAIPDSLAPQLRRRPVAGERPATIFDIYTRGFNAAQTGEMLGIAPSTVKKSILTVKYSLQGGPKSSESQTVVAAYERGVLQRVGDNQKEAP